MRTEAPMFQNPTRPSKQPTNQFSGRGRKVSHAAMPSLGGKDVPKDDLKPTKTNEELDLMYGLATNQAITLLGGDGIYTKWTLSKKNPLEDVKVGFDVAKTEQCQDIMKENAFPIAGILLCKELLPNAADFVILREEYFKRWETTRMQINKRLNTDALIRCSAAACIKKINKRVAKFARSTFDRIHAIKYMTKDSLMKSKKAGAFTGTKILRISLIVGWINDLIDVVHGAVFEFEEWLDGCRHMFQQFSYEKPRDIVERMARVVDGFEAVHDVAGGSSDSENAGKETDSEDEEEWDEEEVVIAKPATTTEPSAAENTKEPSAAKNTEEPSDNTSNVAGL
jgi:hypothetical protein